jgi:hypothetical protein
MIGEGSTGGADGQMMAAMGEFLMNMRTSIENMTTEEEF